MSREFTGNYLQIDTKGLATNGKIYFYTASNNQLANLTNYAGSPISNPVDVKGGTIPNVFLPDEDIRWIQKNTSNAIVKEDYSKYRTQNFNVGGGVVQVDTNSTLSSLSATDGAVAVSYGYYVKGDRNPVWYKFAANSQLSPDGGHVLSGLNGKWVSMPVEGSVVDSMLYGVKGEVNATAASSSAGVGNMSALNSYAQSVGKTIELNTSTGKWFKLAGGTYNICGDAIVFCGNDTVNVTVDEKVKVYNTSASSIWTIRGKTLKTSKIDISGSALEPTIYCDNIHIDSSKSLSLSKCVVYVETNLNNTCHFTDCTIFSDAKIKCDASCPQYFTNCYLKQGMFQASGLNIASASLIGCNSNASDWTSGYNWVAFCNAANYPSVDLNGMEVTTIVPWTSLDKISNGTITTFNDTSATITLENITVDNLYANTAILENCSVANNYATNTIANNSSIAYTKTSAHVVNINAVNSVIASNTYTWFALVNLTNSQVNSVDGIKMAQGKLSGVNAQAVNVYAIQNSSTSEWEITNVTINGCNCPVTINAVQFGTDQLAFQTYVDNLVITGVASSSKYGNFKSAQGYYFVEGHAIEGEQAIYENIPVFTSTMQGWTTPYWLQTAITDAYERHNYKFELKNWKPKMFNFFGETSSTNYPANTNYVVDMQVFDVVGTNGYHLIWTEAYGVSGFEKQMVMINSDTEIMANNVCHTNEDRQTWNPNYLFTAIKFNIKKHKNHSI